MLTLESARRALRTARVRLTPQRLMVIDVLMDNRTHPTVEEVYDTVRRRYPKISLATVYNTVALLARHNLILELHGGKDGLRCDPDTTSHAHAYCRSCGEVFDIPLRAQMPCTKTDFCVEHIEVTLQGLCRNCREQET